VDLPDGYDADAPGAIAVYDLWARRNSCDADNVSDACESGDEDWVTKYIPESKKDDEDVVVEDAPGARDTTVYEASQCAEGGGATLLVVDQCGSRLMGHGLFHNLAYLEAILNWTEQPKPSAFTTNETSWGACGPSSGGLSGSASLRPQPLLLVCWVLLSALQLSCRRRRTQ